MVVPISGIGSLGSAANLGGVMNVGAPAPSLPDATTSTTGTKGTDFGSAISNALESVNSLNQKANAAGVSAATGDAAEVHQYMIAATEASVATELAVAVRNRAVEAFQEIMRMQV